MAETLYWQDSSDTVKLSALGLLRNLLGIGMSHSNVDGRLSLQNESFLCNMTMLGIAKPVVHYIHFQTLGGWAGTGTMDNRKLLVDLARGERSVFFLSGVI